MHSVHSEDGMTADWVPLPTEVLKTISSRIVNEVKGVNRAYRSERARQDSNLRPAA